MSEGSGKQLLENTPTSDMRIVPAANPVPAHEEEQPKGTVKRVLNFQDRSLLVVGCKLYCAKPDKGGYKAQAKLARLDKAILFDETVEYFDMIDDSIEDELFKWQRARNDWLLIQQYLAGGVSIEEVKKRSPELDIDNPPEKPPRRQPEATPEDIRGQERPFYLPSKLDSWVQDVLKEVNWPNPEKHQYITELCEKFGVKSDED